MYSTIVDISSYLGTVSKCTTSIALFFFVICSESRQITTGVAGDRPAGRGQARGRANLKLGARGGTLLPQLLHARAEAAARVLRPVEEHLAGKVAAVDVLVRVRRTLGRSQDSKL